ncbi:hypothetical protein [Desulfurobacterium sp.]|uniref:hypothetical protein n=1 Tax=Desulfurobacterium sp. TaxID=2004706 RepID=UPI0026296E43|nr:hypothetical protein [Desulfurobacterium sp.]
MKTFRKLMKCSNCGNVSEFEYLGSRDVNKNGEVSDIIGSTSMWISYYKCPNCNYIDVEFSPIGEKPDVPQEAFREVGESRGKLGK